MCSLIEHIEREIRAREQAKLETADSAKSTQNPSEYMPKTG